MIDHGGGHRIVYGDLVCSGDHDWVVTRVHYDLKTGVQRVWCPPTGTWVLATSCVIRRRHWQRLAATFAAYTGEGGYAN